MNSPLVAFRFDMEVRRTRDFCLDILKNGRFDSVVLMLEKKLNFLKKLAV